MPVQWTTYASSHYGYSIDYPSEWIATPASQDWPSSGFSYPDDPAVDKWANPSTSPYWVLMFVLSVPLNTGEAPADRIAKLDGDNAQVCQLANRRDVSIDGVAARQEDGKCFGSDYISELAAVHGNRFYMIYLLSATAFSDTTQATFDRFVASFRFQVV